MSYKVTQEEYKGHPTLVIRDANDKIVVSFGTKKAQAIVANLEDIKAFAEKKGS